MRNFLIIGIATDNDLFVSSVQGQLESENDTETAQKIIEHYMNCLVDRVLIVEAQAQAPSVPAYAGVVNDFNANYIKEGE